MNSVRAMSLVMALAGTLTGRTIFVDGANGDDSNSGISPALALRTPSRGLALCNPGDTLLLDPAGSPYADSLSFGTRSGLPGNPITMDGQGSVLTGLTALPPERWETREGGRWFLANSMRRGAMRPFLVDGDARRIPDGGKTPETMPAGTAVWRPEGVWFRAAAGRSIGDYALRGTLRASGVAMSGARHVIVRNLTCEYFANDGFNVHGHSYGLRFEAIQGRHNGDDGFSVHEDVGASVHGGWFHHNSYGIQDVNASRSFYTGVLCEQNRLHGIHFAGGMHSVTESVSRGNGRDQIRIETGPGEHLGMREGDPVLSGMTYLADVVTIGGTTGITVGNGSRASLQHCSILGSDIGLQIHEKAVVHAHCNAILHTTGTVLSSASADVVLDQNLYSPGTVQWLGQDMAPSQFATYQARSGQDASSVMQAPRYLGEGAFCLTGPFMISGRTQRIPGGRREPASVFAAPLHNLYASGERVQDGATHSWHLDFEGTQPPCLVYPSPEQTADGTPVQASLELTDDLPAQGNSCLKLDVEFPETAPRLWLIKLFTIKLQQCRTPVTAVAVKLRGTGTPVPFRLRIRDRSGECFYGPTQILAGTAWEQVTWDLTADPPDPVFGGDGNQIQNGPPMEIVVEFTPRVSETQRRMTVFVDDLLYETAPGGTE